VYAKSNNIRPTPAWSALGLSGYSEFLTKRSFAYVFQVPGFLAVRQGSLGGVVTRSGLILDDRYRLDERIAAGGVGQVWRATDLLLERPVAVKVLRPEYSDHPETLERFRKEARNAGALSNSHVAQVYDYGPSGPGGSPYLVMEFVDGPSLADILVVDPIEPARALDVIAQAAEGLAAAHKAGVIHRDIKPGNILISMEGHVKVTDFGIAHAAGQAPVTGPGLVMGTTQYMAPERIAGNHGTAASDLYALGIVLHECLTGVPPHDGTAADVMAAHLYLPLPPLPANVPAELDVLVDRLTNKDPAKRISDAGELADLAAMLRDSIGGFALVPLVRNVVQSGPGAAMQSRVPQSGDVAVESPVDWPGADGQAGADSLGAGMTPNTAVLSAPDGWGGPRGYASDEWTVPPRTSRPPVPPVPPGQGQQDQPQGNRRKRAGAVAIGVAVLASAGLVALLVSGAFSGTPAANQSPVGTATTGAPATGQTPSHGSSGPSRASAPGSAAGPSSAATTGATGTRPTTGGKKPSTSPSAHPSTGSPASSTGSSGSGTPSGGSSSSGSPTGSHSTSPSGTSSPSPSPSACLLGICF
jgi:eukaryotic-like serine/threonine-protein kinase